MGKHAIALAKAEPQPHFPSTPAATPAVYSRPYAELAARLFTGASAHTLVAFAGVHRGAGVSRTVRGLASELVRTGKSVAALDGWLRTLPVAGAEPIEAEFERLPQILGAPLSADPGAEAVALPRLHDRYDCVLVDCGSLEASVDLLRFAPLSDGVVLVVEAGRTTKEQIDRAAQVIREAKGKLLGFVLNKRRYPIPGWLYRRL